MESSGTFHLVKAKRKLTPQEKYELYQKAIWDVDHEIRDLTERATTKVDVEKREARGAG